MESPLLIVSKSYIKEVSLVNDPKAESKAYKIMEKLINGIIDNCIARQSIYSLIGTDEPAERIIKILKIAQSPGSEKKTESDKFSSNNNTNGKKKRREWSNAEDQRLLAGMHIFGLNEWSKVAKFVGNNRTRAQCSQRWNRGLDPRIFKGPWTEEEEEKLLHYIKVYGDHAWKSVAANLDQRSDAQCRYHYSLMMKRSQRNGKTVSNSTMPTRLNQKKGANNDNFKFNASDNKQVGKENIIPENEEKQNMVNSNDVIGNVQNEEQKQFHNNEDGNNSKDLWPEKDLFDNINLFGFSNSQNDFFDVFFSYEWSLV